MEFLADDELTLNKDDPRFKPKSQRGAIGDGALGALSGIAMGTVEVATAPDALISGDKKAAQGRAQSLEIFKPNDLGAVGEFTYGLTKDFTRIGWNALTTLGTGGVPGLALNSGLFGYQTFEAEKSDLLNKGADLETARVGGAIKGVTDAASFIIPTHGVTKSVVTDAVATTALATAAGSAGDYIEGSYLEQNSNKKVAQYGEALKENALSPSTLAANGGMALLLNLWANKGRLRPEQVKEHSNLDTMNDAAHIQANIEHAEGTNPFVPTTPNEANAHFYALDSAMESALNDELVSLKAPVTGTPKAVVSSTPVVPVTGTPKAIVRPSAITADEYKEPVIAKAFSNPVFDKKPWAKTIAQEALTRGINPIDALVISHIETGGTFSTSIQPKDRNGKLLSSATGLFQTLDSTFARMGGKNKFDGNDQIKVGLNYYEHNAKVFRSHFNRDPNGLELYYLHFFGEGGGPVFLKAKDNELFVDVATRWSKGNQKKTARQIAEGITSSHQFNGMTVGQVKAKYEKRWNDIAKLYSDVSSQNAVQPTEIRGSESEFPQFESDITAPPTYKSQSDAEIEAMPFVLSADEHSVKSLQEEFEALSSPLTKEDLEYLKATAHYQYSESGAYRTPYVVEPQVDLSGPSNSANRTLDTLDFDIQQIMPEEQRAILAEPEANTLNINTRQPEQGIQQKSITQGIDNWAPTRSSNYLKREQVLEDGRFVQELHNKASNTTFQREVNQDGTISPVKATRNGNDLFAHSANGKANSPELTAVQHKATQALEREFWRPSNSNKVDGTPDLTKSSKGDYGAFTDTADGREAVSILEADLDMEITFTRLDENGNEEVVTMSSRDLLDYIKEQEEIAKDEIQAVKALASCALKFGSEAA